MKIKKTFLIIWKVIVYCFASAGFILIAGFFAVKYHVTDEPGFIDAHNQDFQALDTNMTADKNAVSNSNSTSDLSLMTINQNILNLAKIREQKMTVLCDISDLATLYPVNASIILKIYQQKYNDSLAQKMLFAAKQQVADNGQQFPQTCDQYRVTEENLTATLATATGQNLYSWINDDEWKTISGAIIKDKDAIIKAATVANLDPRLITANLSVEQLRLFHSQRELFEKFFRPLTILGNATKTSLGVMGIKEATAIDIENHLTNPTSPYYLGSNHQHDLDFTTDNKNTERYNRLTDENNHYYSYLYAGLYLKEMLEQWRKAGFNVSNRPEIIGTLFNVGFSQSHPNASPKVGGAAITIGDKKYTFGSLSFQFYYSGELDDLFPLLAN